ncbi:transcriptional regulator [Clostridium carboxidivorans P7]|uniref:Transcriptional regulator, LysR family n=1 Tax=Clostridium carboxidivorans P7 TaxID=536227 RepID=C6PY79_9CLOT|nr:LysR family transcriptional regulator [Clostridium carboxidivorans]AKN31581.1 transcriptional regulator [Clostridium carboxidivorans P7]EET85811.1 transcriptional regulator, LysR family [Clostridium carboxidivorans P7]EFG87008.1 LysR substrate binding domain protein [Clostridium carboxidivorans P7]
MTLRHFKIFVAVCDKMNMTKASDTLFMSQSAVSQAISELENHYGLRLFERLSKKLYITQAGEKLLSYARYIIKLNIELENEMKTLNEKGSIRIGASVTVGAYVLPKLVSHFQRENTEVDIQVYEENTTKIEKMLLHDEIDLALVEGETTNSDIINKPFMNDELVLICGANHRFSKLSYIEPHELEKEKFIIREEGSGTRKTFEDKMIENQLTWQVIWVCNNTDTIKTAVAEGLGVSVISRNSVMNELDSAILYEILIKGIKFKRQFKIIYHKNKYLTEIMQHFMDYCEAKYK